MRRLCILVLSAFFSLAGEAAAQDRPPTVVPDSVTQELWRRAAAGNWHVRVITPGGDTVAGRARYINGEARLGTVIVPDDLLRVERRIDDGRGQFLGAAIGAMIVGVIGAGLADLNGQASTGDTIMGAGIGAGIGGLIGILAGSVVAPGTPEWRVVWP